VNVVGVGAPAIQLPGVRYSCATSKFVPKACAGNGFVPAGEADLRGHRISEARQRVPQVLPVLLTRAEIDVECSSKQGSVLDRKPRERPFRGGLLGQELPGDDAAPDPHERQHDISGISGDVCHQARDLSERGVR
jgi:hypothetical protein